MKKLLLILFLFLPFIVSAQKLLKPNIDKISGDTVWSTSTDKLYLHGNYLTQQGEAVQCFVVKIHNVHILYMIPQTLNEQSVFSIDKGQKAYLKFSDKSLITLTNDKYKISDANVFEAGNTVNDKGSITVSYILTDDDIKIINNADLTFVRFETSNSNFDCDIKPKFAELIRKQIALVDKAK
jgi:hypothetical protein